MKYIVSRVRGQTLRR